MDILDLPAGPGRRRLRRPPRRAPTSCSHGPLSEFLLTAAILLELKSQRLLPGPDDVDDDEELAGLGGARPAAGPAPRAAGPTRRRPTPGGPGRAGGPLGAPPRVGLDDGFVVHAPDLLAGVTPDRPGPGVPAGHRRAAEPPGRPLPRHRRHRHRRRDGGACSRRAARRGPTTFRELTDVLRAPASRSSSASWPSSSCASCGRVALGQGHTSATCTWPGWPTTAPSPVSASGLRGRL